MTDEWTPEQVMAIRRVYRRGGTVQEAMAAINSTLAAPGFRKRAIRYGMRFLATPSIHRGTSVLMRERA